MILRSAAALFLVAACTLAPAALAQGTSGTYEKLNTTRGPAIVNVKFLLKVQNDEQEEETPGVMIEKGGLVLVSNLKVGGVPAYLGEAVTPTELKVLVGDDLQGVEAKIIARDSELGLAWVQIDKPSDAGYPFVDFGQGAAAKAGDNLMVVTHLGKFFDRASVVNEGKVIATPAKPHKLLIPSVDLAGADFGTPVFNDQAAPVGVITILFPEQDELQATPGGMNQILKGVAGGKMILPADEIVAATKRAKEAAASGKPVDPPAAPKAEDKPTGSAPSMGDK
jgi:hypothetical protein